ncbi:phage virion morphogenesis protein [Oceanobacter sp. 4_MG-2023]|uniref:phage virion morphogenesis protein n=1 Tax=Oceanobacter sp. 4_MG-2023 TaxID=3062623 RepID=UPI002732C2F7|nr:phage virion morphogenesis protein [Oceanobacter sp. 4_MG-2023]MDP2548077.1 phage virion morphogenesis protein [Oceanobacter sp. 4_MG-2023]
MITISVTNNSTQVLDVINQLQQRVQDTAPVMRKIAGIMADQVEQAFADEADPATGKKWRTFSPSYLQRNPKRSGGQLLQDSGQLASSIQNEYGPDYAAVGTNKIYAAIHQFGGLPGMKPGPAAIPARPYLGLSPEGEQEIIEIVLGYLGGGL